MALHNLLTCSGFGNAATGYIAGSSCIKARLGLVVLFFIVALVRKWGGEEVGLDYSFLFGLIGGLGSYFLVVTIFGSFKIALVVGLVGSLVAGYGAGMLFGSEGSYE